MSSRRRLLTLALLYVSQSIPLGFFIVALPAILRAEGLPLEAIGLLSALATPWLLKFLWAPLVDRHGHPSGHFRSWLIPLQIGCVATVAVIAGLDLATDMPVLVVAGGLFMLLSATQDVATDGLAVRILRSEERGLGNGIQVGGYSLGQILGGGLALVLHARFGWTVAVGTLGVLLALPLPFVLALREPDRPPEVREAVGFRSIAHFVRRPGILPWIGLLLLWRAAETSAQWMFNPMLVDRGLSLETIGVLLGVVGSLAAFAGAILGGWVTGIHGTRPALLTFGGLLAAALLGYLVPALELGGMSGILGAVAGVAAAGGMATAALYTAMMDHCRDATAATDFTVQQSLAAMGPLVASSLSGVSAAALGYPGHFALVAAVQVAVVALAARVVRAAAGTGEAAAEATA